MENGQPTSPDRTDAGATTAQSSGQEFASRSTDVGAYRPSGALRGILNRGAFKGRRGTKAVLSTANASTGLGHAPAVSSLLGAGLTVGAVAGFLELLVQAVQIHWLHQIEWTTLTISRHAGWMAVATSSVLVASLTLVLLAPALAWAARRQKQNVPARRLFWTWDVAGVILGTLLFFGPLQMIHGLHAAAAAALALGAGVRCRRLLVRRASAWQRMSRRVGIMAAVLVPLYSFWQWHSIASTPDCVWSEPGAATPNVIWIVADTLRADHMSVYGYNRPTTPELEKWAKEGITFDMARSAAPWTLPSHVTMFTGLWPSEHGSRVNRPYASASPTIAEYLRSKGYATAGFVSNVRMCNRVYGVNRGFDTYIDFPCNHEVSIRAALNNSSLGSSVLEVGRRARLPVPHPFRFNVKPDAKEIGDRGREWLDQVNRRNGSADPEATRPFFLFLNVMDVHGPYLPSRSASGKFWHGPVPPLSQATPECGWVAVNKAMSAPPETHAARWQELGQVSRRLIDLYDECLSGLDVDLGHFLSGLRSSGALENTWVVITGDHGEHFGEHNQFGHGSSLYNELTHVPLIVIPPLGTSESDRDPARTLRGRRIKTPVSLRDLPATVAGLIDPNTKQPFPGQTLARHWNTRGAASADPVLSQLEEPDLRGKDFRTENIAKMDSLIADSYVLIENRNHPDEVYHLFNDPLQQKNLAELASEQAPALRLKQLLDTLRAGLGKALDDQRADVAARPW